MILYLLNKDQQIIKAISTDELVEAKLKEQINTAKQLTIATQTTKRLSPEVYYICVPSLCGNGFSMFKITSESVQSDRIEYTGLEAAYDELRSYRYVKDIRPENRSAREMLTQVLQGTRWTVGYTADTGTQSTNFYYITVLEAVQKIVQLFNLEVTFDVMINPKTQQITGREVNLYQQQGQRTGKRFEYGSNLLTVEREENTDNLVTALVGRGKGELVSEGATDTDPDGYGRRITFADVVWSKANGDPADKPAGQEYVEDPEATALYGFSDGKPRIGLTVFEDITDPTELLKATWAALQEAKRPKVSFRASVTDVGDLGLGDTVAIIRHDLRIEYFTRVYSVTHDLQDKNNNVIELGDDFSEKSLTNYVAKVENNVQQVQQVADHAVLAANGKNKNYYSTTKPTVANEGDNLFLDLGNGETEHWIWHHGEWEFVSSTLEVTQTKKLVEEAQAGLDQAKTDITANKQAADSSIANLTQSIADNKVLADNALQALNTSVATLQSQYDNNIVPNLNQVTADVADALQRYTTAQQNIADLTAQAQQQGTDIATITSNVNGLSADFANLQGDVNSTKVTVNGIQTTVGTANGDIAQLKLDAQSLQTMLAGKVDNTTYTNFVNLTNQALNARLTASDLNGYAKTADVQATANGLRVDLNSVTDRMNNLKVGGRNLVASTDREYTMGFGIPNTVWQDGYAYLKLPITLTASKIEILPQDQHTFYYSLTPGQEYTQTVWFETDATVKDLSVAQITWFTNAGHDYQPATLIKLGENKYKLHSTYTWPGKSDNNVRLFDTRNLDGAFNLSTGTYLKFGKLKLEEGNVSTDWSPAVEDTAHDLAQLSARITTTSQQFSSYYTKTETDNRTNSAKNDAINTIRNDGNWQGLSNILTNSGFLQTADGFLQKVQQTTIPMFSGGGVNLVKDTSESEISGKAYDIKDYYFSEPLEPNTKYTISIDAKVDQEALNHQQFIFVDPYTADWSWGAHMSCISASLEYQHYRYTFITPDASQKVTIISVYLAHPDGATNGDRDNLSGTGYFKKLKVERGEIDTPYSHAPSDNASQIAFSELAQSLEGLRSTVSGNYGQLQNTINQTNQATRNEIIDKVAGLQNQITTTANGLDAKIGAIQVGGRNLLIGTSENEISGKAYNFADYQISGGLQPNKTYTLSGWARVDQDSLNHHQNVFINAYSEDWSWSVSLNINSSLISQYNKITFTTPDGKQLHPFVNVYLSHPDAGTNENSNDAISGWSFVKKLKLEEGNIATDYTHAPEDTDQAFTEVNATIEGLRSTVGSNYGSLQSQINQTATTLRGEVTDKVNGLQGQITTQANNINLMLGTAGDLSNICRNPTFDNHDGWTDNVHVESNWSEIPTKNCGVLFTRDGYYGKEFTVVPGDRYYTSVFANNQNDVDFVLGLYFKMKDGSDRWLSGSRIGARECRQSLGSITVPDNAVTAKIWASIQKLDNFGFARFTNVIVKKNDTLAQINMSAGTTLIQNNKIYMDASSTVFSGNAFIPSAAITSLDADKITTGTLNAANVNIINLNADNIVAGTLRGSNGEFILNSGSLHVWQGDHNTWVDQNGIHDYENGNDTCIQRGQLQVTNPDNEGFFTKDGAIELTSKDYYNNNYATKYGKIMLDNNMMNVGTWGMNMIGRSGWALKTANYDGDDGWVLRSNKRVTGSLLGGNETDIVAKAQNQIELRAGELLDNGFISMQPYFDIGSPFYNKRTGVIAYAQGYDLTTQGSPRLELYGPNDDETSGHFQVRLSNDSYMQFYDGAKHAGTMFNLQVGGKTMLQYSGNELYTNVAKLAVQNDLMVYGSKNAVVPTSQGMTAINAYETAEYYFGDISEGSTDGNGMAKIKIDPLFLETVNTKVPYQVFLTAYDDARVWIADRSGDSFTVKSSSPNTHFAWEIKAKRKGYEKDRLKTVNVPQP